MGKEDVYLGGGEDVLNGHGDFRTNAITLNQADEEVALKKNRISIALVC